MFETFLKQTDKSICSWLFHSTHCQRWVHSSGDIAGGCHPLRVPPMGTLGALEAVCCGCKTSPFFPRACATPF